MPARLSRYRLDWKSSGETMARTPVDREGKRDRDPEKFLSREKRKKYAVARKLKGEENGMSAGQRDIERKGQGGERERKEKRNNSVEPGKALRINSRMNGTFRIITRVHGFDLAG